VRFLSHLRYGDRKSDFLSASTTGYKRFTRILRNTTTPSEMSIYNLDQHAMWSILSLVDCLDNWSFARTSRDNKEVTKSFLTKRDLAEIRYYIPIDRDLYYNIEELCWKGFLASLSRVIDNPAFEPCEHLNKDYLIRESCTSGHLDIVKFLYSREVLYSRGAYIPYIPDNIFITVCSNGYIDVAKWLLDNRLTTPRRLRRLIEKALGVAIENGHCKVIELLKTIE